ncbi:MAG: CBS domain-containing protein [Alphaproteobacteria bacterium]
MIQDQEHQTEGLFDNVSLEPIHSVMKAQIVTCAATMPVADVAATMAAHRCGSIVVVEEGRPIGIWTEGDALRLDLHVEGVFDEPISRFMTSPLLTIDAMTTLQATAVKFREHGIRHLIVVDGSGAMVGIVSQTDVVLKLGIHFYLSFREVGSIVFRSAFTLDHDVPVAEAVARLHASGSDGALVTERGIPIGIVTERDVVRMVAQRLRDVPVGEVATRPLVSIPVDSALIAARDMLNRHKLRHLVVTGRSGEVLGLLSMADILAAMEHGYVRHLEEVIDASNRQLAATERRLTLILQSAGEGMVGLDPSGRVTFVNLTAARLTGRAEADMVGCDWHALVGHQRDVGVPCGEGDCPMMAPCAGGPEARLDRQVFRRADGSTFPVELVATPLAEGDRQVGAVLVFRDITQSIEAQKAIREREELFRQMFERNAAVKLLIDPVDGAIVDANGAAEAFYGHPRSVLTTLRLTEIAAAAPEAVQRDLEEAESERCLFFRSRHRQASGAVRDVEMYAGPVRVNGRSFIHAMVTDVTDRNRFQSELEAMTTQLRRSNDDLQQFAYVASHDLQEPLRMVVSYLELIRQRYTGVLDEDGTEFIGYAVDGARRMQRLIRDLLEFSRVDTRGNQFKEVALAKVMEAARANLSVAIAESDAVVTIADGLPVVLGDDGQLTRLFQNLIGNALKYRHTGRRPEITVAARRDGDDWRLTVTDNGIGIDAKHFERIFLIFQRLHGHGEYEGSGIGLAICKRIAERHGGRIWVESDPGHGSHFHVALPGR